MLGFGDFERAVLSLAPQTAIVLGSGLGEAASVFAESTSIAFADVPRLVPPTVHGHGGRLAAGRWGGVPVLLVLGRLHLYEGHAPDRVTAPVQIAAGLGVKRLILTNAGGGIHPELTPGSLMAIGSHLKLLNPGSWRAIAARKELATPYHPRLTAALSGFHTGVYAALTGPTYETPAEIRALAAFGADAVGMSTALEAEAAAELGLEVAAISCITNLAAGLADRPLAHSDVIANAGLVTERLRRMISQLIAA
jgi:purine-nucleoside phosphorylase